MIKCPRCGGEATIRHQRRERKMVALVGDKAIDTIAHYDTMHCAICEHYFEYMVGKILSQRGYCDKIYALCVLGYRAFTLARAVIYIYRDLGILIPPTTLSDWRSRYTALTLERREYCLTLVEGSVRFLES